MEDTIYAPATAPGRAAVAVVRVSGPQTPCAIAALTRTPVPVRRAVLRTLRDGDGEMLDRALVLGFAGPHSYTGEDAAELHLHGGQAVVEGVLAALGALGLRMAEPGEFTRRAFQNGKLDLAQAEAIADLVDAETDAQRCQALAQYGGALGRRYDAWREALLETLALLEAGVDFPDEALPEDLAARAEPALDRLIAELGAALADAQRGDRIREGYRIALVGAPNAGKSSLLNRLVGRDAAIVTPTPGTTRDLIEAPLVLGGFKVLLADMAGLRAAGDAIEAEGVRRARVWAEQADLRIWVVDGSADGRELADGVSLLQGGDLLALNKSDLPAGADRALAQESARALALETMEISAATATGLEALRERLIARVVADLSGAEFPAATRERHAAILKQARTHLGRARVALHGGVELAAEDVRLAARALAKVSGRIDPEDVLERVFASFCIGK